MFELDFHVISIFCLHRALDLIHSWKLVALEKIERGRKSLVKKKEVKIFVQRHYAFNSWIEKTITKQYIAIGKTGLFYNSMGLCGNFIYKEKKKETDLNDHDKRNVGNGLLFPRNFDLSSLTPEGPFVPVVCDFRRRDNNLLSWR